MQYWPPKTRIYRRFYSQLLVVTRSKTVCFRETRETNENRKEERQRNMKTNLINTRSSDETLSGAPMRCGSWLWFFRRKEGDETMLLNWKKKQKNPSFNYSSIALRRRKHSKTDRTLNWKLRRIKGGGDDRMSGDT